jgi:hypothetical protein
MPNLWSDLERDATLEMQRVWETRAIEDQTIWNIILQRSIVGSVSEQLFRSQDQLVVDGVTDRPQVLITTR